MLNFEQDRLHHTEGSDGELYGTIQAAKKVGISIRQLYHWVDILHAVNPRVQRYGLRTFRRFTTKDLGTLVEIKVLLERGYTLRAAIAITKGERER